MITHIHIKNYRSFVDAEVDLQPFSLVIGANGAGKTNLLRFVAGLTAKVVSHDAIDEVLDDYTQYVSKAIWQPRLGTIPEQGGCSVSFGAKKISSEKNHNHPTPLVFPTQLPIFGFEVPIYNISAEAISGIEVTIPNAQVLSNGAGTAQVLDTLKNGDREDLFDAIEMHFKRYVPEIEKLSLRSAEQGKKQIQVRERGLKEPLPATELSEGTRLILCILTIIHQEKPPPVILLEDIDRGMHPRIFEQMVPLMKDIAKQHDINIIATTHNPFLVDCFEDDPEAVIIVEKKDGASTLSTLKSRMEGLDYDTANPDEMPLGNLWYSGLVGGVPLPGRRRNRRET